MALDVFSSVRYLLKPEEICIDNWIFKLHYRVTVMLFLGSSAIGVSKQYFGDPINCQVKSYDCTYDHSISDEHLSVAFEVDFRF